VTPRRRSTVSEPSGGARAAAPEDARIGGRATSPISRVTIRDVAEQAGVSLGTVSNVLNRPQLVAAATRLRVLEVIDRIGFIRSSAAHQLRGGASRSFGAVVLDVADPFSTETVRGLEDAVHERESVLMLCSTDGSPEREASYLRMLEEQRVQGIVITPAGRSLRQLEALQQRGTRVVLLDRRGSKGRICSISVDHTRGGELAAGHLLELGHRRIAFINGPLHLSHCAERRRGIRQAARRHGLDPDASVLEYTVDPISAVSQAELAVDKLLSIPDRPTAVVCVNDQIAFTVLRALFERRVRVPRDMSVVGHDDAEFAAMLSPALTSVRWPKYELGRKAAELLIAETSDPAHRHGDIRFEPELVVRESTTPRARLNRYRPGGG
jgi:LacI family transcriptional regulator